MTRPIHADVALKAAEPLVLEPARNSSLAVASLVLGIASWLGFSFLASLPAVVTGHIAMNRIKTAGGTLTGDGMATAGLIIGYLNIWVSFFLLGLLTTILSSILRKLT